MSKKIPQGYWKGKPVEYLVIMVIVTNRLTGSMPWCKPFIGEKRQAVKVVIPNHRPFYLDNEDGSGLVKILKEKSNKLKYRSLGEPKELEEVPRDKWQTKLDKTAKKATEEASDAYWKKKLQHLRRHSHGAARHGNPGTQKP